MSCSSSALDLRQQSAHVRAGQSCRLAPDSRADWTVCKMNRQRRSPLHLRTKASRNKMASSYEWPAKTGFGGKEGWKESSCKVQGCRLNGADGPQHVAVSGCWQHTKQRKEVSIKYQPGFGARHSASARDSRPNQRLIRRSRLATQLQAAGLTGRGPLGRSRGSCAGRSCRSRGRGCRGRSSSTSATSRCQWSNGVTVLVFRHARIRSKQREIEGREVSPVSRDLPMKNTNTVHAPCAAAIVPNIGHELVDAQLGGAGAVHGCSACWRLNFTGK